jgi:hypothetical protein
MLNSGNQLLAYMRFHGVMYNWFAMNFDKHVPVSEIRCIRVGNGNLRSYHNW